MAAGFEPGVVVFVELLVCSEPAESIEAPFALPTKDARVAVEPEAPCSRHDLLAVVDISARQVSGRSAPDEPVRSEAVLPEAALPEAVLPEAVLPEAVLDEAARFL